MGAVKELLIEDITTLARRTGADEADLMKRWLEDSEEESYNNFELSVIRSIKK